MPCSLQSIAGWTQHHHSAIISFCAAAVALGIVTAFIIYPELRYNDFRRYARDTGMTYKEAVEQYGKPCESTEWVMSLSNAAADEDWDRLEKLTAEDRHSEIGSYYRNLAKAMKGELSTSLMSYYAPFERALFMPVGEDAGRFNIAQSGEVWYQLGEMTMAEHSAMLGLIFSRKQCGRRFLQRLGEINHIWGDEVAASKYFSLACRGSALSEEQLEFKRSLLPNQDRIHSASDYRAALKALVEAGPGNRPAYEYLVCLDLLCKNLEAFVEDFNPQMPGSRLYQEAGLIWMASTGDHSEETARHFGIEEETFNEFGKFSQMFGHADLKSMQERFGKTYWFYFKYATRNEKK